MMSEERQADIWRWQSVLSGGSMEARALWHGQLGRGVATLVEVLQG